MRSFWKWIKGETTNPVYLTAGPCPGKSTRPVHECEHREDMPLYEIRVTKGNNRGPTAGVYTTRAVRQIQGEWQYFDYNWGYWARAWDNRNEWEKKYGLGDYMEIYHAADLNHYTSREERQVYPPNGSISIG